MRKIFLNYSRQLEELQKSLTVFQERMEKKISSLKSELNYESLNSLIKARVTKDEFTHQFSSVLSKFKNVRETVGKVDKEVHKVSEWVMTLSKATSDIEKVVQRSTPLALNKELDARCLSCGHEILEHEKSKSPNRGRNEDFLNPYSQKMGMFCWNDDIAKDIQTRNITINVRNRLGYIGSNHSDFKDQDCKFKESVKKCRSI